MRISDWSSDVCSSDLAPDLDHACGGVDPHEAGHAGRLACGAVDDGVHQRVVAEARRAHPAAQFGEILERAVSHVGTHAAVAALRIGLDPIGSAAGRVRACKNELYTGAGV